MTNRCAYLDADHNLTLAERPMPLAKPGEIVVKIAYNGICGSDVHFFREGRLGNFVVTRPYVPGHECSGTVAEVGAEVEGFRVGERVVIEPGIPCGNCDLCRAGRYNLCASVVFLSAPPIDGTLQDYVAVRADAVFAVPDGLSLRDAALAEPVAVAVHAVNRARMWSGASGAVIGAGPIGLLVLQAFKAAGGGHATVVDPLPSRLAAARALGADICCAPGEAEANCADVGFETAGSDVATAGLIDLVRPGGRAVQVGWPKSTHVAVNVAGLMEKEIDYMGVNRYANAYPAALRFLADGRIRADEMITQMFPFDRAVEAFEFARDRASEAVKIIIEH